MRHRDQEGADSFDALTQAIDGLRNTALKVQAVGSADVVAAIRTLDDSVGAYFVSALDGGVFRAARFNEFFDQFMKAATDLLKLMRIDLEIDRVYTAKA